MLYNLLAGLDSDEGVNSHMIDFAGDYIKHHYGEDAYRFFKSQIKATEGCFYLRDSSDEVVNIMYETILELAKG